MPTAPCSTTTPFTGRTLALGLGPSPTYTPLQTDDHHTPNVSFSMDPARVYLQPDEERCIFHAHHGPDENAHSLVSLADTQGHTDVVSSSSSASSDDVVPEPDLPFTWKKLALDREEERLDDIELVHAWVVDMPDPTYIGPMLRWLKQAGLDQDALSHLKRVRRQGSLSTLLLDTSPEPPALPPEPALTPPYQLLVPCLPALTLTSLSLKNTYWPTVFTPKRKWEPGQWTRTRVCWASDAVCRLKEAYAKITQHDELPIVAHVPIPYQDSRQLSRPFFAHDTRTSTRHPLRHAALDIIRQVADYRTQQEPTVEETRGEAAKNGAQYLLTGLSLFITHEPCLMCTMALLHSRVKEVFYLVPMPNTGGCGGIACIPSLKGVNHRFSIAIWKEDPDGWPGRLDAEIDA